MTSGAESKKITKRVVDSLRPRDREYSIWDAQMPGFGVRVRPSGAMSYVVVYRAGGGRSSPVRRYTIGSVGKITPEKARNQAQVILGSVAQGRDPAGAKSAERGSRPLSDLADRFLTEHVEQKRKPATAALYKHLVEKVIKPDLGHLKADKIGRQQIVKLHSSLKDTPFLANRALAVVSSIYAFAAEEGLVPEDYNPTRKIEKFQEHKRERFLTVEEIERLGAAIREAEETGIPWDVDEEKPKAKHLPKAGNRVTRIGPYSAAAVRLLLFTGCRLREILHLKWEHVDTERGLLFLPDSKTGKKTIVLNAPALAVLAQLERTDNYVIAADRPGKPKADLKRPWSAISRHAGLSGVRLHDLRHTYASFGAGGGLGLPIIGKLLGHTQASTTQRYAHLDADPLKRAAESIGGRIAAALDGRPSAKVTVIGGRK